MLLGMKVRPLKRVGVYAPGGKARYPSSVLMTAIPARVAGVKDIVLATPATLLTPAVVFAGVMSSAAADAGYLPNELAFRAGALSVAGRRLGAGRSKALGAGRSMASGRGARSRS